MDFQELVGVPMAFADVTEALTTRWDDYRGKVEVVRVARPPSETWPDLIAAGFLPKPNRLTWIAPVGPSDAEFLARMPAKERYTVRSARLQSVDAGLRREAGPLTADFLDEFLRLYDVQIGQMRHGLPVARMQRESILVDADRYHVVRAHHGGELVGACLSLECPAEDVVRIRFSAVAPHWRAASLARVLYLDAVSEARARGFGFASLGNDPNLYGHVAKPGLFSLKHRLGFAAVPSHAVQSDDGWDDADRILGFGALTDPLFLLSYADYPASLSTAAGTLRLELFSSGVEVDARPYQAGFLAGLRTHLIQ
jgi:hypothetical protein